MESVLGGTTQHEYEADLVIGNVAPSFGLVFTGRDVHDARRRAKHRRHHEVNVGRLAVRVSQIFQNNLLFFLDGGRFYDYSYGYDDDEEGGGHRRTGNTAITWATIAAAEL